MNTAIAFLIIAEVIAAAVAAAVVGWYYWSRGKWDTETARLKAKGLPWIVLLVLTAPVTYVVGSYVGAGFGPGSGVLGLLFLWLLAGYTRRLSAEKKWSK